MCVASPTILLEETMFARVAFLLFILSRLYVLQRLFLYISTFNCSTEVSDEYVSVYVCRRRDPLFYTFFVFFLFRNSVGRWWCLFVVVTLNHHMHTGHTPVSSRSHTTTTTTTKKIFRIFRWHWVAVTNTHDGNRIKENTFATLRKRHFDVDAFFLLSFFVFFFVSFNARKIDFFFRDFYHRKTLSMNNFFFSFKILFKFWFFVPFCLVNL